MTPRERPTAVARDVAAATSDAPSPSVPGRGAGAAAADWPAAAAAMAAAEALLRALPAGAPVAVASDADADGLCAGALAVAALERTGRRPRWIIARRGEHPHDDSMRARIAAPAPDAPGPPDARPDADARDARPDARDARPDALIVLDMGSRAGPIVEGLPTIVVDHHAPSGAPDGAVLVTAYGHPPVAPTSLLAFHLLRRLAPLDDLEWLAVLGAYADRGDPSLPGLADGLARAGRAAIADASALVNAARRAPDPEPEVAAAVLRAATSAGDIQRGRVPGVDRLREHRRAVNAEVARCGRAAPRFAGEVALIRIRSRAQVHPLLAARWSSRLPRYVAMVANDGFRAGRVNFSMRTGRELDLVAMLRGLDLDLGTEFGHGHPGASGGSVTPADFDRLLERLGFPPEARQPAAGE